MCEWEKKDLYTFALDCLIPLLKHCNDEKEKPYGIPNELTHQVEDKIRTLLEEERKHNCQKWFDEGCGCSICSCTLYKSPLKNKQDIRELQEHNNARIMELNNVKSQCADELEEALSKALVVRHDTVILDKLMKKWRSK